MSAAEPPFRTVGHGGGSGGQPLLALLPPDVLEVILCQLLGGEPGGCAIRATCKRLRAAYDGCNRRLILGGAQLVVDTSRRTRHALLQVSAPLAGQCPPRTAFSVDVNYFRI